MCFLLLFSRFFTMEEAVNSERREKKVLSSRGMRRRQQPSQHSGFVVECCQRMKVTDAQPAAFNCCITNSMCIMQDTTFSWRGIIIVQTKEKCNLVGQV
jgi:hypothetical protein